MRAEERGLVWAKWWQNRQTCSERASKAHFLLRVPKRTTVFMCCWISFAFVLLCSILLPSSFPNLFFLFPHIIYFFSLHLKQLYTPFLGPFSLIFLLLFFRTWWHPLILIFTHFRFFSGHLPFHFLSCCLYHDYPVMRGGDVCRELRAGYYVELWVSGSGLLNNEIGWEDQNIPEPLN